MAAAVGLCRRCCHFQSVVGVVAGAIGGCQQYFETYRKGLEPGNYEQMLIDTQRLEKVIKRQFGTNSFNYGLALKQLGVAYDELGRYSEAKAKYEQTLAIYGKTIGPNQRQYANALLVLGNANVSLAEYLDAIKNFKRAIPILEKGRDEFSRTDLAATYTGLGNACRLLAMYNESEQALRQALTIAQKLSQPTSGLIPAIEVNLAAVFLELARYDEAEKLFQEARPTAVARCRTCPRCRDTWWFRNALRNRGQICGIGELHSACTSDVEKNGAGWPRGSEFDGEFRECISE